MSIHNRKKRFIFLATAVLFLNPAVGGKTGVLSHTIKPYDGHPAAIITIIIIQLLLLLLYNTAIIITTII